MKYKLIETLLIFKFNFFELNHACKHDRQMITQMF